MQSNDTLRFHPVDNDQLLCYSKRSPDGANLVLVVVNLNFHEPQHGFVELPLVELGIDPQRPFRLQDLLAEGHEFTWQGPRNFVDLDPQKTIAHVFRVVR